MGTADWEELSESAAEVLQLSRPFAGLPRASFQKVASIAKLKDFTAGERIIVEGQPGQGLYVVVDGQVEAFLEEVGPAGRRATEVRFGRLHTGTCFGEYSLFDDGVASASVRAVSDAKVMRVSKSAFRRLAEADERLARIVCENLLHILIERLRAKDSELDVLFTT